MEEIGPHGKRTKAVLRPFLSNISEQITDEGGASKQPQVGLLWRIVEIMNSVEREGQEGFVVQYREWIVENLGARGQPNARIPCA